MILGVGISLSCDVRRGRRTIAPEVESAIASISDDIAAERYEKIYQRSF